MNDSKWRYNHVARRRTALLAMALTSIAGTLMGADGPQSSSGTWHPQTLMGALGYTALFALFGIGLAILGYKLFDFFTPGSLHREIVENRNTAAAMVGAAVILGVCIIIAAAMIG